MGAPLHWAEISYPPSRSRWVAWIAEEEIYEAARRLGLYPKIPRDETWIPRDGDREVAWRAMVRIIALGGRLDILCAEDLRPAVAAAWEHLGKEWCWHALVADDHDTVDRRKIADAIFDASEALGVALGIDP